MFLPWHCPGSSWGAYLSARHVKTVERVKRRICLSQQSLRPDLIYSITPWACLVWRTAVGLGWFSAVGRVQYVGLRPSDSLKDAACNPSNSRLARVVSIGPIVKCVNSTGYQNTRIQLYVLHPTRAYILVRTRCARLLNSSSAHRIFTRV